MRGILWQQHLDQVRATLGNEYANILKEGAEVLLQARVHFHPVHGLALHIEGVDLSFSLGELERRKQATIAELKREGLFDRNRQVPKRPVLQRVAVITSLGSAAHGDLVRHLAGNEHGYRFHVHGIHALVQGDGAAFSLRAALAGIDPSCFDAVLVVRGGGSKLDLEAFNDLELCRMAAQLPIPVLTGIGHDVDVSVLDMIAAESHKTPTALADHLVDRSLFFETQLRGMLVEIVSKVGDGLHAEQQRMVGHREGLRKGPVQQCRLQRGRLHTDAATLRHATAQGIRLAQAQVQRHAHELLHRPKRLLAQVKAPALARHQQRLEHVAQHQLQRLMQRVQGMREAIALMDPQRALARGFSIARSGGVAIADAGELRPGDELETTFARGRVRSTVQHIERDEQGADDL
jgi:exodeoxyribonuclease VII large subunit